MLVSWGLLRLLKWLFYCLSLWGLWGITTCFFFFFAAFWPVFVLSFVRFADWFVLFGFLLVWVRTAVGGFVAFSLLFFFNICWGLVFVVRFFGLLFIYYLISKYILNLAFVFSFYWCFFYIYTLNIAWACSKSISIFFNFCFLFFYLYFFLSLFFFFLI